MPVFQALPPLSVLRYSTSMPPRPPRRRSKGPVLAVIWDGFGIRPPAPDNPIPHARMPVLEHLEKRFPNTLLRADGEAVGLPEGQVGNSEAGHAVIGAGRPLASDLLRINRAIDDGSFFDNPALLQAAAHVMREQSTLHLVGLLTNHRSGHASMKHLKALIRFADELRLPHVALHLFTDGRDTHPFQALPLLEEVQRILPKRFAIASLIGRFYGMDRNRFWRRTELAYRLIAGGEGVVMDDPAKALTEAYARGESDEFVLPTVLCRNGVCVGRVKSRDAMIFFNLRSDRARQFLKPFVMTDFETREPDSFLRPVQLKRLFVVTLTEFGTDLDHAIPAFPHRQVQNTLVEALRYQRQTYGAESEKFSQVTYFLNGGFDRPRFGEERFRVPSLPLVKYDERPEMSADVLTKKTLAELRDHDFVLVNFANADMVAHSGSFEASVKACETLDRCLGKLWHAVERLNGTLVLTSDHGNIEQLRNIHGGVDTEHNPHPVPFLVAGSVARGRRLTRGTLADVAPTILALLGVQKPEQMTGRNLLR